MIARLVLGYILALPIIVPIVAASTGTLHSYSLVVTMTSTRDGHLQVFYDDGGGYSEQRSATVSLLPTQQSHEYRLALPAGRYRRLRMDPGTVGGRYEIERAEIVGYRDRVAVRVPLAALRPANHVAGLELRDGRLVIDTLPDATDPQLEYVPETALLLPLPLVNPPVMALVAKACLVWLCGVAVVYLGGWLLRTWQPTVEARFDGILQMARGHQRVTICFAALVATVVSTYPLVFLGRSLVTPNNNALPLLYDSPPFTPGSTDVVLEDVRGSDVSATIIQGLPHTSVERLALADGEVPLWNRYNASGRPLWGQGLTFMLDPLHWATLLGSEPALGWDVKFIAHRLLFAIGIGLLSAAATGGLGPSLLVAAASVFGGIYSFRFNHPALFALTYAPWVLLAWHHLAQAKTRRQSAAAAIGLALSTSLLLVAATPKEAAVMLLGVHAAGALMVWFSRTSWGECILRLCWAAVAGIAVLLVTMPHWLVFFETLGESFTVYDKPVRRPCGSLGGRGILPQSSDAWPRRTRSASARTGVADGCRDGPEAALAVSDLRCRGGCVGGTYRSRLWRGSRINAGQIPLVGNIGHINDAFVTAALPLLLIVCACGARILLTATGPRVALVTCLVGVLLFSLLFVVQELASDGGFEPLALMLITPLGLSIPACLHRIRTVGATLMSCAAAFFASFVLLLPGGLHVDSGIAVVDRLLLQPRLRTVVDQNSPAVDAIHHASHEPSRAIGVDWALFSGSQALDELEGIGGADPLELPAYRELVDASRMWRNWGWFTMVLQADVPRLSPLLDMLNVGYVLSRPDNVPIGVSSVAVVRPDRLVVGRRPTAWPRAFYVDGVTSYTDAVDLLRHVASDDKPIAGIQGSDTQASEATRRVANPTGRVIPAVGYNLTANTTSFTVRADGPGVAVLTETFLPDDFQATLNGAPVPYFRVNHAFKGVVIPSAGVWRVKFEYRPKVLAPVARGWGRRHCRAGGACISGRQTAAYWRHSVTTGRTLQGGGQPVSITIEANRSADSVRSRPHDSSTSIAVP